jgi:signal peptidase I
MTTTAPAPDDQASPPAPPRRRRSAIVGWLIWLVPAILIGTGVKTYLGEPYKVPSGSMTPTIEPGDWIVANKLADDLADFRHGDLVVFLPPPSVEDDVDALVKRIIGLPGDEVTFAEGLVMRNGAPLDEPYLAPGTTTTPKGTESVVVPEGAFFVLGDNRSSSIDSRIYGSVAGENIIGRASLRFWPLPDAGGL